MGMTELELLQQVGNKLLNGRTETDTTYPDNPAFLPRSSPPASPGPPGTAWSPSAPHSGFGIDFEQGAQAPLENLPLSADQNHPQTPCRSTLTLPPLDKLQEILRRTPTILSILSRQSVSVQGRLYSPAIIAPVHTDFSFHLEIALDHGLGIEGIPPQEWQELQTALGVTEEEIKVRSKIVVTGVSQNMLHQIFSE